MGFSLVHTLADAGIVFGASSSGSEVQQSFATLTVLIGLMYTWWAWVFARAVGGANSGLVGLMAFDVLWVGLNGVSIIYCLPPCGSVPLYGDTLHLGTLILGPLAAYFAYRAMRRRGRHEGRRRPPTAEHVDADLREVEGPGTKHRI
jgi:hypothetical protein